MAVLALRFTPTEIRQGLAQKIFYIHAPSAWCAFLAVTLTGARQYSLSLAGRPALRPLRRDVGRSRNGVLCRGAHYGSHLGKADLGHLVDLGRAPVADLFLFFLLLGYQVLRSAIRVPTERARLSAVVGIMAMVLVPFIHLSVYLFRGCTRSRSCSSRALPRSTRRCCGRS
jgi:heme exporter protein C